jgi:GT2 family glycosyltransferase
VYKREAFLSVGGFDENIKCWEDADLHVKLAAAGCSFAFINEVLAYSLRHNNGISNDQLWCWGCRLKFIERYLAQYPQLDRTVLELELKNVQNAFVIAGDFKKLKQVMTLKKKYQLTLNTNKIATLYYLNKVLSSFFILKMLRLR